MPITNGSVRYMERRKIAEYEHKEAIVELSFSVDTDETYDAVLRDVLETARAKAREMLGLKSPVVATETTAKPERTVGKAPELAAPYSPKSEDKPAETKAPEAPADAAPGKKKPGRPPASAAKAKPAEKPAADPLAIDDEPAAPPAETATADPTAIEDEPAADEVDPLADMAEITDKDLQGAVKDKHLKSAPKDPSAANKIRKLIQEYGKTVPEIPQEKRVEFLQKLEALA